MDEIEGIEIDALPNDDAIAGTEILTVVDAGVGKTISVNALETHLDIPSGVEDNADVTDTANVHAALGVSPSGTATDFLNEQGNFVTVTPSVDTNTQLTQAEVRAFADQAYVRSVQDAPIPNTDTQLTSESILGVLNGATGSIDADLLTLAGGSSDITLTEDPNTISDGTTTLRALPDAIVEETATLALGTGTTSADRAIGSNNVPLGMALPLIAGDEFEYLGTTYIVNQIFGGTFVILANNLVDAMPMNTVLTFGRNTLSFFIRERDISIVNATNEGITIEPTDIVQTLSGVSDVARLSAVTSLSAGTTVVVQSLGLTTIGDTFIINNQDVYTVTLVDPATNTITFTPAYTGATNGFQNRFVRRESNVITFGVDTVVEMAGTTNTLFLDSNTKIPLADGYGPIEFINGGDYNAATDTLTVGGGIPGLTQGEDVLVTSVVITTEHPVNSTIIGYDTFNNDIAVGNVFVFDGNTYSVSIIFLGAFSIEPGLLTAIPASTTLEFFTPANAVFSVDVVAPSIQLGASSTEANRLDDYEEGTWTPVTSFLTATDGTSAFLSPAGQYTRIGNIVKCSFQVTIPANTDVSRIVIRQNSYPFNDNPPGNGGMSGTFYPRSSLYDAFPNGWLAGDASGNLLFFGPSSITDTTNGDLTFSSASGVTLNGGFTYLTDE